MDIKLITIPQVDWSSYISFYKEYSGETPTRTLDRQSIPLESPKAFKEVEPRHYYLTFLVYADIYDAIEVLNLPIDVSSEDIGKGRYILTATGKYEDWWVIVKDNHIPELSKAVKEVLKRL